MTITTATTDRFAALASLLLPPRPGFREHVEGVRARFESEPAIRKPLDRFLGAVALLPEGGWEELHLRTFDLAPQCVPYVSVYVFGEESFRRSQLMVGLREAYARIGFDAGVELPDHITVLLRSLDRFSVEEIDELRQHCLDPALIEMNTTLKRVANPYRFVISAVHAALAAGKGEEAHRV